MSKSTLLQHLSTQGKTSSWEELASIHNIKSGEAARSIWKRNRENQETFSSQIPSLMDYIYKGVNTNTTTPIPPYNLSVSDSLEKVIKEIKERPQYAQSVNLSPTKSQLLEISFPDLHIGKKAWDEETGDNYDIDIAIQRCKAAIDELISRVDTTKIEKILLPLGNDMLHVDNKAGTTTAGTPVDADSRFGKMFRTAKELVIDIITKLSTIAPVDVLIVPGNHDEATIYTLGEILDAWYRNEPRVTINNSPKLRKYYQYGKNMVMLTHGDKEKYNELGLIAATEEPMMWGTSKYREVHVGHFHKSKSISYTTGDEYPGFKIRVLPSLSSSDAWHVAQGFISMKGAKAFIWDKEKGLITEHTYNLV